MNILSLSDFAFEYICDVVRFSQYSGERNISQYCGYASDFISQAINDNSYDGIVFPRTCDSTRIIDSYLDGIDRFVFQINVPGRSDELGIQFYKGELNRFLYAVNDYYDVRIEDDHISGRIALINQRNNDIREIYQDIDRFTYADYLSEIHRNMFLPLIDQHVEKDRIRKRSVSGEKKVFILGSFLSNTKLIEMIEANNLLIVGDNLPESGRLVDRCAVSTGGDLLENISRCMIGALKSPSQNDFSSILLHDFDEIKRKKADGIIMVSQKYCEPYDFLYSIYKKKAEEIGIPMIKIQLLNSEDMSMAKLQIEAFAGLASGR